MVDVKPGTRLQSTVCTTEVIVVRGSGSMDLRCGGTAMVAAGAGEPAGPPAADAADGSLMGKRYTDAGETVEVLVTKAGEGSLGLDNTLLELKDSKPLPASD